MILPCIHTIEMRLSERNTRYLDTKRRPKLKKNTRDSICDRGVDVQAIEVTLCFGLGYLGNSAPSNFLFFLVECVQIRLQSKGVSSRNAPQDWSHLSPFTRYAIQELSRGASASRHPGATV